MALRRENNWTLPFANGVVETQPFGTNAYIDYTQFGIAGHNGNDIIPTDSDWNIRSISNGVVVKDFDIPKDGYGNYVTIWDRENSVAYQYAHMSSNSVTIGQEVKKGQVIGVMGNTGFSTGAHLHFAKYVTDANGMRLNRNNGFIGAVDGWADLVKANQAEVQASLTFEEGGYVKYNVQNGGWRSSVITEIIRNGILEGVWQDHDVWFHNLNPTPTNGWKPGDVVVLHKVGEEIPKPGAKPAWMAKLMPLQSAKSITVEKDCAMFNVVTGDLTIPSGIKKGEIVAFSHEYGDYYMKQENVEKQQPVGYLKSCVEYVNEDITQEPTVIEVNEAPVQEEEIPVVTTPKTVDMPDEVWNEAKKFVDSDEVVFVRTNQGNAYRKVGTNKVELYTPVGEFKEVEVEVETVEPKTQVSEEQVSDMAAEFEAEKMEANTTDYVSTLIEDIPDKETFVEDKKRFTKQLEEFIKQGEKKFPGMMNILMLKPIRDTLKKVAQWFLWPLSLIQAGSVIKDGETVGWTEIIKLLEGFFNIIPGL